MRRSLLSRSVYLFSLCLLTAGAAAGFFQKKAQPKPAVIEVLEVAAHRDQTQLNIDSKVKNTGERVANELVVIVDVLDSDKRTLTTQTGSSEPASLEAGEEGEFHAQMPLPPRAVYIKLSFEETGGRYLKATNIGPFAIE
jgi:hypothetical protein